MGNTLASVALFAWPVVVIVLFRRLPAAQALAVSVVGGYLLLPTEPNYNLPLLPAYGKNLAAVLPALVMAFVLSRPGPRGAPPAAACRPGWIPRSPLVRVCLAAILAGACMTVLTNGDALAYPLQTLPGLRPYDAAASILSVLTALLPFLLARKFLARSEDHATLLAVLAVAALAYTLPALWEVRMSPRLNAEIYGFFAHDWRQHLRAGGYRPVVFLEHGLRLGLFLAIGILAMGVTLRLVRDRRRAMAVGGLVWLLATLVLSKNLTAFVTVMLLLPVVLALRERTQLLVAAVIAGTVLVYPMMRATGLVPVHSVTNAIATFADSQRLGSLTYRLINEDILLEKANERPLFGWGGWGRARVYDERGRDVSTTDGAWIIEFGENGWIGYLARFGLLVAPVLLLAFRRRDAAITMATSGLAVVLAANLLDLLPNSGLTPITWLMAGALAGRLETRTADAPEAEAAPAAPGRPGALPYRRHFPGRGRGATGVAAGAAAGAPPAAPVRRSPVTGVEMPPRERTS